MKFLNKIWHRFLRIFGNIKVFKFPFFIVYDPDENEMDGEHILKALKILQPGDIIFRGYKHYADGFFIPSPRKFSHAGIYTGNNTIIHAVSPNVVKCNVVDFMMCDRIAIVRPKYGQEKAIERARQYLNNQIKYDFDFSDGDESLYCFELCAYCYEGLKLKKHKAKILGGLIKKKTPVYLDSSFFISEDFYLVFEYNKRFLIDFCLKESN